MSGHFTRRRFLRIAAACAGTALVGSGMEARVVRGVPIHRWRGIAFGTGIAIDLAAEDEAWARSLFQECRKEIARLEGIFSLYDDRSSLMQLNREGELREPPFEMVQAIAAAHRASVATAGAFDISVHPVCELLARHAGAPPVAELARARALVDYRGIACDCDAVRLMQPGMQLTFNGVAQGLATDVITERLRQRGCSQVLVDLGERRALGEHPLGRPWRVGIEMPERADAVAGVVELSEAAIATSGGYGGRFGSGLRHHLVNALTGESCHEFASLSVVAPTALQADVLSTSLAVLPAADFGRILQAYPDIQIHVVDTPGARLRRLVVSG